MAVCLVQKADPSGEVNVLTTFVTTRNGDHPERDLFEDETQIEWRTTRTAL